MNFKGSDLLAQGSHGIAFTGMEVKRIYPNAKRWEVVMQLFGNLKKENVADASPEKLRQLVSQRVHQFANRAFRRPVTPAQSKPYVELALDVLEEKGSKPGEALFQAYRAILWFSPIPYLLRKTGLSRSNMHWPRASVTCCGIRCRIRPCAKLPTRGNSRGKKVHEEASRMLNDPRSERFVASFTDQWLNLKEINFTSPDVRRFQTFDPVVQDSLVEETRAFFGELIRKNHRIHNLIDSDFAMLNERLVRFYGMKNLPVKKGGGLQKVSLGENRRGGLITHGSVLKVTADGTSTSPVVRGIYVSERILGIEIPPPPPGIPAVEPDIRGAVSIRDQLDKHRNSENCAACHRLIDPAGFALENFDPVGLWRSKYGNQKNSARVDPSGITPGGKAFQHIAAWKSIYLEKPDQLAEAFARHLLNYATGAKPGFSDRDDLDAIVAHARENNYGMRSLVHAVVSSEPFRTK